jgi:hypothetical protein
MCWIGAVMVISFIIAMLLCNHDKLQEVFVNIFGFCLLALIVTAMIGLIDTKRIDKTIIEPTSIVQTNNVTLVIFGDNQTIISRDGWVYHADKKDIKIEHCKRFNQYNMNLLCDDYNTITVLKKD